jgi:hypothetical protein
MSQGTSGVLLDRFEAEPGDEEGNNEVTGTCTVRATGGNFWQAWDAFWYRG